jgi:CHASE3 domain sensor protein
MHRLKKWQDLSLRVKGVCVVAIPAAATVVIACLSYAMTTRVTNAQEWVGHTRRACEEIQKMETLDAEATAEIRAYLLTGDHAFTLRLWELLPSFDSARRRSAALTADRPAQQARLVQIAGMARLRSEHLLATTALFRSNPLPPVSCVPRCWLPIRSAARWRQLLRPC